MRRTIHQILGSSKTMRVIPVRELVENISLHACQFVPHGQVSLSMPYDWAADLTAETPYLQVLLVAVDADEWNAEAEETAQPMDPPCQTC